MSGVSLIISTVGAKVAKLLRHAETLQTQLKYQEGRNNEMLAELAEKNKKLSQLEDKMSKLQNLQTPTTTGNVINGRQDTKLKINEMVREIDKCIALLNR